MKTQNYTLTLPTAQLRQAAIALSLIAVGLVLSLATFARGSQLQISLWNGEDFTLEMCGERYYSYGQLTVDGLKPGQQRVRIIQSRNNSCGNGGRVQMLYNGFIKIPRNSDVIACVRPNRQVRIVDIIRHRPPQPTCAEPNRNRPRGNRPRGERPQAYYDEGHGNYGHSDVFTHDCTDHCDHTSHDGYSGHGGYGDTGNNHTDFFGGTLSAYDMEELLDDLSDASFESERFLLAKQRLANRQLTSIQVKRIMMSFWFEDTKLRFAKFAYSKTTDPGNFWVVNDAFQFENSVHELDEFIQFAQ